MIAMPTALDRLMECILFVSPNAAVLEADSARTAKDALSFSLLFVTTQVRVPFSVARR